MLKNTIKTLLAISLLMVVLLTAGCDSGADAQRVPGLTSDAVVKTFYDAAKNNRMSEAGLYVSASSKSDPKTVLKFMTGQSGVDQIKNSNILSVNQVTQQDSYAVVAVTMQEQSSLKITIKPVGLEKIGGEWYIVDLDQVYADAKYNVLLQLLGNI